MIAEIVKYEAKKYFAIYLLINGIVKKETMKDILVNYHRFDLIEII